MTQRTTEQNAATLSSTGGRPLRRRPQKVGLVISNKMDKTIVVAVERLKMHPLYKKTYRQTKHFYAHDENNICQIGDIVRIEECRPLSKLKRWRLIEVIKRGSGVVPVEQVLGQEITSELERVQQGAGQVALGGQREQQAEEGAE
ncbi:30S ribosomal protein S17 [Thermogemmatispora tikiterensis]|uniref:Small ribosomal subunit protein uS17 n=2 Tax=Thermogemmatispora tikiterensis TaxID=1825093 RepID=A0A328VT49_9CHLR|nr:30S ribosomal protein S17 [Thermogemmatispora tikiterensis]